jgi:hypothetical protein
MIDAGKGVGGGMMQRQVPQQPTAWMPYVEVDNVKKTVAKAKKLGANVMVEYMEIPNGAPPIMLVRCDRARYAARRRTARSCDHRGVEDGDRKRALYARSALEEDKHEPARFRSALLATSPRDRDAWVDLVLGLEEILDDGPELPRGCVPYLPCPVDALLRTIDAAGVRASDVFVDVGSGAGRAAALVRLLTGASVVGMEIQPALVRASRNLATRLGSSRFETLQCDATRLPALASGGSVYFLYCPFGGEHLTTFLSALEPIARSRTIRLCCIDLPIPATPWLSREVNDNELSIHRST